MIINTNFLLWTEPNNHSDFVAVGINTDVVATRTCRVTAVGFMMMLLPPVINLCYAHLLYLKPLMDVGMEMTSA